MEELRRLGHLHYGDVVECWLVLDYLPDLLVAQKDIHAFFVEWQDASVAASTE